MATANLMLECAVGATNGEPYAKTVEQSVTYQAKRPSTISGEIVMGLELKEQNGQKIYNLYRKPGEALFGVQDDQGELAVGLLKIGWDDLPDLAACFVVLRDNIEPDVKEQIAGINWKFLLTRQGDDYKLIHMESDGPGSVDECKALKNACGNTIFCKLKLKLNGCPL